ncbi:EamA family transporter [Peribacillus frigoritolerans]|nr:EamA family transporter [Peribacillus frigoritolerans]
MFEKEKLPSLRQFKRLLIVAFGAVLGFPLLTSWAMESLPVSHGAVELALLPLATAGFAIFRAGEIPSLKFWIFEYCQLFSGYYVRTSSWISANCN